jgi:hypothetical protein
MPRGGNGIEVKGLRETVKNLEQAGVSVNDLKDAMRRVGSIVSGRGQSIAPKKSGRLAASTRPTRTKNRARVSTGKASLPYAPVIHWGWKKHNIEANPFLLKALGQTKPQVIAAVDSEVHDIARKANT